jgi:hypothetical protein
MSIAYGTFGNARRAIMPLRLPLLMRRFDFVINRKTADTLGLTVPPTLVARADQGDRMNGGMFAVGT